MKNNIFQKIKKYKQKNKMSMKEMIEKKEFNIYSSIAGLKCKCIYTTSFNVYFYHYNYNFHNCN